MYSHFLLGDLFIYSCKINRRRLAIDGSQLGPHSTDHQRANIIQRSTALRSQIRAWYDVQQRYCAAAAVLRIKAEQRLPPGTPQEPPHTMKLYLPSALDPNTVCDVKLQDYEWQLRRGQAHDALDDVRNQLRLRAHLYSNKDRFHHGQRASTRASTLIKAVDAKINAAVNRYQNARNALLVLSPRLDKSSAWQATLKVLNRDDVRGMSVAAFGESEGRRTLSWIWMTDGVAGNVGEDPGLHDCTP